MYLNIQRYIPPERIPDTPVSDGLEVPSVPTLPFCVVRMRKADEGEDHSEDLEEVERHLGLIINAKGADDDEAGVKVWEGPKSDEVEHDHSRLRTQSPELKPSVVDQEEKHDEENRPFMELPTEDQAKQAYQRFSAFLSTHGSLLDGSFGLDDVEMIGSDEVEGEGEGEELDRAFATYLLPDLQDGGSDTDGTLDGRIVYPKEETEKTAGYDDSGYASVSFDSSSGSGSSSEASRSLLSPSSSLALIEKPASSSSIILLVPETKIIAVPEPAICPKPRSSDFLRQVLQREHDRAHSHSQSRHRRQVTFSPHLSILPPLPDATNHHVAEIESADESSKKESASVHQSPAPAMSVAVTNPSSVQLDLPMDKSYLDKPWFHFEQPPPPRTGVTRKIRPLPERARPGPWLNPRPFRKDTQEGGSYGSWVAPAEKHAEKHTGRRRMGDEPVWGVQAEQPDPMAETGSSMDVDSTTGMEGTMEVEAEPKGGLSRIGYGYENDPLKFETLLIPSVKFPLDWQQ